VIARDEEAQSRLHVLRYSTHLLARHDDIVASPTSHSRRHRRLAYDASTSAHDHTSPQTRMKPGFPGHPSSLATDVRARLMTSASSKKS
jgi:hypothetical protein